MGADADAEDDLAGAGWEDAAADDAAPVAPPAQPVSSSAQARRICKCRFIEVHLRVDLISLDAREWKKVPVLSKSGGANAVEFAASRRKIPAGVSGRGFSCRCLPGAEQTVARVAHARQNKTVFIQRGVDSGGEDLDVRVLALQQLDSLLGHQQAEQLDVPHAALLE